MNINLQTWLLIGILFVLVLIYWRATDIYLRLTERQRLADEKKQAQMKAWLRESDLRIKAWANLSEQDKDRFNDFHYEHCIGKISDEEYDSMKKEFYEKTGGHPI